jgi:thiamine monophosphate synthase
MSSPGAVDPNVGDDEPDPGTLEFTVPSDWDNELALTFYELVQKALDDGFPIVVAVRKDATPDQISQIVDEVQALVSKAGLAAT